MADTNIWKLEKEANTVLYSLSFLQEAFEELSNNEVTSPEGLYGVCEIMRIITEHARIVTKIIRDISYNSENLSEVYNG
jgi:hypothetical protein